LKEVLKKFDYRLAIMPECGRVWAMNNTTSSRKSEIKSLTSTLAGYVSRLTMERSTLSEAESALLSARANETMLRLLVLQSEVEG
jgi:hypothetical protein